MLRLAFVVALLALAAGQTAEEKEAENLRAIADIPKKNGLVPVSDYLFPKIVLAKHRPYHAFVLFSTANTRGECHACDSFASELAVLSESYDMLKAAQPDTPPVFFVRAYYHENQQVFQQYSIKGVPMFAYYAPTTSSAHSKSALPPMFMEEVQDAERMALFVKGYTGVNIEVYRSPVPGLLRLALLLSVIAFLAKYAREQVIALVQFVLSNKTIWMTVSLGIYFISVSGVLYDVIRGVPWAGVDGQGQPIFIAGSGSQFIGEGLFIGALNLGCAACMLLLKSTMAASGAKTSESSLVCLLYGFGFAVLYRIILSLYRSKNRWY